MFIIGPEYGALAVASKPLIDIQCNNNYAADIIIDEVCPLYGYQGIRLYNNHATNKIWNVHIARCMPENNTDAGVLIESPTNQIIERIKIFNSHFYDNCTSTGNGGIEVDGHSCYMSYICQNTFEKEAKTSIYLMDEANNWTIGNNLIYDGGTASANTYMGISLIDVDYITTTGNNVANITTANLKGGFYTDNSTTYSTPHGNTFKAQTYGMHIGTGAGMDYDFKTNNSWPR